MIKKIGQFTGLIVGTTFSPGWVLMNMALRGYFDLTHAMTGPLAMLTEFQHFITVTEAYPEQVLYHLCPVLVLVLMLSSLFVCSCSYLGGQTAILLAQRFRTTPAKSI